MMKCMGTFCRRTLLVLAVVCTLTILLLNVFFHSNVSYDVWEIVTTSHNVWTGLSALMIALVLMLLFSRLMNALEKIKPSVIFAVMTALYAAAALYLIYNQNNALRADASFVYKAALDMKDGIFTELQPEGYIGIHPHQVGMMVYDWFLLQIAETPIINFSMNWLMVIGINFTCWQISRELKQSLLVQKLTILISFSFFPQLFLILFAYGEIPGLFFLLLGFYHTLRVCADHRWTNWFGMFLCISIAIVLRTNNLIGAIACILFLLLHFLRDGKIRRLAAIAAVAICMILPSQLVKYGVEQASGIKMDGGIPYIMWAAMGTDIDNRTSGPGWFDFSPDRTYRHTGSNREVTAQIGFEKLNANLEKIRHEPKRAALFFREKLISVWCDPLYESIWSGPMQVYNQTTYTPLLLSIYGGGKAEDVLEYMAEIVLMVVWVGCAVFLFCFAGRMIGWEMFFLYFIGGLLFHLVWEAKSQYVYPYVACLIPFAACGIGRIIHWMQKWPFRRGGEK